MALLSYSNFGNPMGKDGQRVRDAVALLDERGADFEYDGEMSADVALDERLMRQLYPFCRLGGPANILVMPELHSANISGQAAAASRRRHGGRAAADRPRRTRCRSSTWARRCPISSTSRRLSAHDAIR